MTRLMTICPRALATTGPEGEEGCIPEPATTSGEPGRCRKTTGDVSHERGGKVLSEMQGNSSQLHRIGVIHTTRGRCTSNTKLVRNKKHR